MMSGQTSSAHSRGGFSGFDFGGAQGFGGADFANAHRTSAKQPKQEDFDITKNVNLTAKDVFAGEPVSISFNQMDKCTQCNGSGYCSYCGGTGIVSNPKSVKVRIPKGVKEGQKIRLKGEGKKNPYGQDGDLYLIIHLKDSQYQIDGADLTKDIEITPAKAVLGGKADIETLHGKINIKIPEGVSTGKMLRLKNLGLPKDKGFGDLNVRIKIIIPDNLSKEQKQLYKRLAELED